LTLLAEKMTFGLLTKF